MPHLFYVKTLFSFLFLVFLNLNTAHSQTAFQISGRLNSFEDINSEEIPRWESIEVLNERFEEIRDKRFLIYNNESRRIPWLYPKDGCHNKAALFIRETQRAGYPKPKMAYVFGYSFLEIKSPYFPGGVVKDHWFHAAPLIKVEETLYVVDPVVDFNKPLTFKNWVKTISPQPEKLLYAFCSSHTYLPTSKCMDADFVGDEKIDTDAQLYLQLEWNTLKFLEYDPAELLL